MASIPVVRAPESFPNNARFSGASDEALSLLDRAASSFDTCEMALCAAAVRRRRGEHTRGDEGQALLKAADAWMAEQGIKDPIRMTAIFSPGFR